MQDETEKIICEFCAHRRYCDSLCTKYNKKAFIDSDSCDDYTSGGPQIKEMKE